MLTHKVHRHTKLFLYSKTVLQILIPNYETKLSLYDLWRAVHDLYKERQFWEAQETGSVGQLHEGVGSRCPLRVGYGFKKTNYIREVEILESQHVIELVQLVYCAMAS
jgi:hypothetical protein